MAEHDSRLQDPRLQQQINDLVAVVGNNTLHIEELRARADAAHARADAMEAQSLADREMLAELHADGLLNQEHVTQLEEALVSSRSIGTAIGILMTQRNIGQDEALLVLKGASQRTNTKLRDLAATIVAGADAIK